MPVPFRSFSFEFFAKRPRTVFASHVTLTYTNAHTHQRTRDTHTHTRTHTHTHTHTHTYSRLVGEVGTDERLAGEVPLAACRRVPARWAIFVGFNFQSGAVYTSLGAVRCRVLSGAVRKTNVL